MKTFDILHLPHLPKIPEHLINFPATTADFDDLGIEDRYLSRNGKKFLTGKFMRGKLSDELEQWIKTNIYDDWKNVGYGAITAPCHGPHIDRNRLFVLQYVFDKGGPDIKTVFYEPRNQQVEITPGWHVNNYDDLEPVRTYAIPEREWYLINARSALHSTEGITTMRKSVQLSLIKNPFTDYI